MGQKELLEKQETSATPPHSREPQAGAGGVGREGRRTL